MSVGEALVNVLAIGFGVIWLWLSLYTYYPLFKSVFGVRNRWSGLTTRTSTDAEPARDDGTPEELPDGGIDLSSDHGYTFDVLLPAYDESEVIENSIRSVREAAYDQSLINLIVLTEPDDDATRETLADLASEYQFTEICVPSWYPGDQNKPRALNYGFERTDADLVTVIDAENIFDELIFERATEQFSTSDVDFIQGRLDMVNEDDGWLNTLFRAEYGYWYEVVFPPFFDVDYPIPMGGTTCLFRRSVLERVSELRRERYGLPWTDEERRVVDDIGLEGLIPWDPENVTEDFELGLFLWQNRFKPGYLHGPSTDEESPLTLDSWMSQRTRWQKGKIYTFLHYVKNKPDTIRQRIHLFSQAGMPHLGPINLLAVVFLFLTANLLKYDWNPAAWVLLVAGLGMVVGSTGMYGIGYWRASDRSRQTRIRRMILVVLTLPLYWVLHWIADVRAFVRTYHGEFDWAKTTHAGRNVLGDYVSGEEVLQRENSRKLARGTRVLALVAIVVTAVATRTFQLGDWSLHGDELYTIAIRASLEPSDMLFVAHDTHPPLHYLLLHYWMEMFGSSAVSVRSLSAIFGVGTVVAVYYLGVELYDDRAGLAAALLSALSVNHVHYSQNARMYSMMAFFTAVSWYGFAKIRSEPDHGSRVYLSATILLTYTHLFAFFVILAQNIYVVMSEERGGLSWRRWVGLQSIVALAVTPVLWFVVSSLSLSGQADDVGTDLIGWLGMPTLYEILETILRFIGLASQYPLTLGLDVSQQIAIVMFFVYTALAFMAVVRYKPDEGYQLTDLDGGGQMALLLTVPIIVPFLISFLVFPLYFSRYAIAASIGLFVLVGKGIANLDRQWLTVAVVALVILASSGMLADHYTNETEEPIDGAAQCLEAETEPGDAVVANTFWRPEQVTDTPLVYYDVFNETKVHHVPGLEQGEDGQDREIRDHVEGHDQVWVMLFAPSDELDQYVDQGPVLYTLNETHEQTKLVNTSTINIYRYDRPGESNGSTAADSKEISEACQDADKAGDKPGASDVTKNVRGPAHVDVGAGTVAGSPTRSKTDPRSATVRP